MGRTDEGAGRAVAAPHIYHDALANVASLALGRFFLCRCRWNPKNAI
jgi:hypothetical protein